VDVSGHGVASALMTARIASYLSDAAPDRNIALKKTTGGYEMRPVEDVCAKLNMLLQSDADSDQYLTMALGKLGLKSGICEMCQAGHPFPVVQRADGSVEFIELEGTPIGLIDDPEFSTASVTLDVGDRLIFHSDGLTECSDPEGNLLEEEGLARILRDKHGLHGLVLFEEIV
ncbi:unnamed protein product, partial [Ectocarpus sp. 12 AP-2014]